MPAPSRHTPLHGCYRCATHFHVKAAIHSATFRSPTQGRNCGPGVNRGRRDRGRPERDRPSDPGVIRSHSPRGPVVTATDLQARHSLRADRHRGRLWSACWSAPSSTWSSTGRPRTSRSPRPGRSVPPAIDSWPGGRTSPSSRGWPSAADATPASNRSRSAIPWWRRAPPSAFGLVALAWHGTAPTVAYCAAGGHHPRRRPHRRRRPPGTPRRWRPPVPPSADLALVAACRLGRTTGRPWSALRSGSLAGAARIRRPPAPSTRSPPGRPSTDGAPDPRRMLARRARWCSGRRWSAGGLGSWPSAVPSCLCLGVTGQTTGGSPSAGPPRLGRVPPASVVGALAHRHRRGRGRGPSCASWPIADATYDGGMTIVGAARIGSAAETVTRPAGTAGGWSSSTTTSSFGRAPDASSRTPTGLHRGRRGRRRRERSRRGRSAAPRCRAGGHPATHHERDRPGPADRGRPPGHDRPHPQRL